MIGRIIVILSILPDILIIRPWVISIIIGPQRVGVIPPVIQVFLIYIGMQWPVGRTPENSQDDDLTSRVQRAQEL